MSTGLAVKQAKRTNASRQDLPQISYRHKFLWNSKWQDPRTDRTVLTFAAEAKETRTRRPMLSGPTRSIDQDRLSVKGSALFISSLRQNKKWMVWSWYKYCPKRSFHWLWSHLTSKFRRAMKITLVVWPWSIKLLNSSRCLYQQQYQQHQATVKITRTKIVKH